MSSDTVTVDVAPPDEGSDRRRRIWAIFASSSGNLVEWFDFYAYAFTALYFAPSFFPKGNQTTQLLQTACDENGNAYSDDVIYANLMTMLVAGEDTTSNTVAWAVHELFECPEWAAALRREP